jgi:PST family polysaccharide transporter
MALFTGLQGFNILCSIVKMKIVALWLQAVGVGLFGIFNITTDTLSTLTDLGLRQSAVRDVAMNGSNTGYLARVIAVVRRWCRWSGLLGAVVISGLSVPLSNWFFKSPDQWWCFAILAASMLLNAIIGGEQAILQGTSRLKQIARISLFGTLGGLIVSIPMFYYLGNNSVLYSILAYSAAMAVATYLYRYKSIRRVTLTTKEVAREGSSFVRLGAYMAIAAFISNMAQMAFTAYLSRKGGEAEVGYFQAGTTIVVRYVGLIFTALAMEYYPRLAANIASDKRIQMFVNHETVVLMLVLIPILLLFMLLRIFVVRLLYSPAFDVIIPFISWAILSCTFKGFSWCMAFVVLAKGDGRTYIITESVDAIIGLSLSMLCYNLGGLPAVGLAYIGWYLCYTLIISAVYHFRYKLNISAITFKTFIIAVAVTSLGWASMEYLPIWLNWIIIPLTVVAFLPPLLRLWRRK